MTAPLKKNNNDKLEVSHSIMSIQRHVMIFYEFYFLDRWLFSVRFSFYKKNNQIEIKKKNRFKPTGFFDKNQFCSVWIGFGLVFFWFGSVFFWFGSVFSISGL